MASPLKTIGIIVSAGIAAVGIVAAITRFGQDVVPPAERATLAPAERGGLLMSELGCRSCHIAHISMRAPPLEHALGRVEKLMDGTSVTMDEAYLRESILDPSAKIVSGYGPSMPSYRGRIKDQDLADLVEAMK